jgi:replication factor C subunit 1
MSHPMPFMKATSDSAPKAVKKEVPDIEDAIVESEDEGAIGEEDAEAKKAEDDSMDISKDKYVKVPKKVTGKGRGGTSGDEKPKTTRSKPAAKSKASSGASTKGRGKARK